MNRAFFINQLIGEYRLVDFLGAGGMGEVYRGIHNKIGRVAAVKILTRAADGGGFVERFFNEARIQASLQHANIATLYDFLEVDGQPCIVMEYVDGVTVAERIEQSGALSVPDALFIFRAIVEAIGYIHSHGVIHRDIKSNNIKISSTGQVKLLDFGIAKGRMTPGMTAAGNIIGTLEYLAPEQLKGVIADARSDIWALGVLLYEMVTGRVPFESETLGALCSKIERAEYITPAQLNPIVPREVTNIIARCLRKNPADRYQSAQELLQEVRRVLAPAAAATLPLSTPRSGDAAAAGAITAPARGSRQNVVLLAGGGAILTVMLIAAVLAVYAAMLSSATQEGEGGGDDNNSGGSSTQRANVNGAQGAAAQKNAAAVPVRIIRIDATGGSAKIFDRAGREIGATPRDLEFRLGESVKLTLKREGYVDESIEFDVGDNKWLYTVKMNPK